MFSTFSLSLCPFDFRVAFSGSECLLLLSFLCALSGLLCSFPVMLCFQPLCCLVSLFCGFFFSFPLRQMLSRGLSRTFSFQGISPAGAAARSEPYSADLHFHCQFIPFPTIHSFPLNVCMFQFSLLFFSFVSESLWFAVLCCYFFLDSCSLLDQTHLPQNFHCHDCQENQTLPHLLVLRWKLVDFAAVVSKVGRLSVYLLSCC